MKTTRRKFLAAGGAFAAAAAAGCGGKNQPFEMIYPWLWRQKPHAGPCAPPTGASLDLVSHALNRMTHGPRPWDHARVSALGGTPDAAVDAFLEEQLAPEAIDDSYANRTFRRFEELALPASEMFEFKEHLILRDMTRACVLRATLSERQLFETMAGFWSDHFNISASKADCKWLKAWDDREVIRKHALGKFPDLLRASALSPAMLWYLDGRANKKEGEADRANENYARELMELHTLGVRGGYTQKDVMEAARCLTGWTVHQGQSGESFMKAGKVEFIPSRHDDGVKIVLGERIAHGGGEKDLDRLLEIVARHPATARHLAFKLCRKFIAEEPPESAVATVAEAFAKSDGDIKATLRALFRSEEFRAARGTKLKRPFHFIVSALRAADARCNAGEPLLDYLTRMGHAPFQYPTPDGYPEESAPWMGTLLWRWNFAVALSGGKIRGTEIDEPALKKSLGGENGMMAHLLGRKATAEEIASYRASGDGLALILASPGFQKC